MDRKRPASGDDDDERKPPAVVSPEKAKKPRLDDDRDGDDEEDGVRITADSVMGFPSHPAATNRDLLMEHRGFVQWAKRKEASGEAHGNLEAFLAWYNSPEGQRLERDAKGKERFGFGKHRGKTFEEIAREDPDYHVRYEYKLQQSGESPQGTLADYIAWFDAGGRTAVRANARPSRASHDLGEERFPMGCHRGETFREVARADPSYHLRCKATGQTLNGTLGKYVRYFERHGDRWAAQRGEVAAIEAAIGIVPCNYPEDEEEEYDGTSISHP